MAHKILGMPSTKRINLTYDISDYVLACKLEIINFLMNIFLKIWKERSEYKYRKESVDKTASIL